MGGGSITPVTITAHIQDQGEVTASGTKQYVGTKGLSRRLEGFTIHAPAGVELEYMAHIQDQGDTHWHRGGQYVGTKGQQRRLEGFAIRITGRNIHNYDVVYTAHVSDIGDMGPVKNGAFVGTRGQSRRVEGMSVWLESKGHSPQMNFTITTPSFAHTYPPPSAPSPFPSVQVTYSTPSYPAPAPSYPSPAPYPAPGYPAPGYPAPYPAPGYSAPGYPVPGYPAPGYPAPGYPSYTAPAPSPYVPVTPYAPVANVVVQTTTTTSTGASPPLLTVTVGLQGFAVMTAQGTQLAGSRGQSRFLEFISIASPVPGLDVEYMAHIQDIGDTQWHRNGQQVGRMGGGRIEGFAVRLSGPAARQYDVKYFGHLEGSGDSSVQSNGAFVGTRGQSRRLEGIAVWLMHRRY